MNVPLLKFSVNKDNFYESYRIRGGLRVRPRLLLVGCRVLAVMTQEPCCSYFLNKSQYSSVVALSGRSCRNLWSAQGGQFCIWNFWVLHFLCLSERWQVAFELKKYTYRVCKMNKWLGIFCIEALFPFHKVPLKLFCLLKAWRKHALHTFWRLTDL